jgi:hypothetical protein
LTNIETTDFADFADVKEILKIGKYFLGHKIRSYERSKCEK